jgi:hypothetical protein
LLAPFAATQEFDHDPIAKTMTTCDMTCCPILGISGSCRAMIVPFSVSPQKTAAGVYCQVDRVFLNKQFFDSHYLQVSIVNAGNHAGTARLPPLDSDFDKSRRPVCLTRPPMMAIDRSYKEVDGSDNSSRTMRR